MMQEPPEAGIRGNADIYAPPSLARAYPALTVLLEFEPFIDFFRRVDREAREAKLRHHLWGLLTLALGTLAIEGEVTTLLITAWGSTPPQALTLMLHTAAAARSELGMEASAAV
jgi:hypothetical protein